MEEATLAQCAFCYDIRSEVAKGRLVEFSTKSNQIHAHTKCLRYSANLYEDEDGSWEVNRVLAELKRIKKLTCHACRSTHRKGKNSSAGCGCAFSSCKRSFHYPCIPITSKCRNEDDEDLYLAFCSTDCEAKYFRGCPGIRRIEGKRHESSDLVQMFSRSKNLNKRKMEKGEDDKAREQRRKRGKSEVSGYDDVDGDAVDDSDETLSIEDQLLKAIDQMENIEGEITGGDTGENPNKSPASNDGPNEASDGIPMATSQAIGFEASSSARAAVVGGVSAELAPVAPVNHVENAPLSPPVAPVDHVENAPPSPLVSLDEGFESPEEGDAQQRALCVMIRPRSSKIHCMAGFVFPPEILNGDFKTRSELFFEPRREAGDLYHVVNELTNRHYRLVELSLPSSGNEVFDILLPYLRRRNNANDAEAVSLHVVHPRPQPDFFHHLLLESFTKLCEDLKRKIDSSTDPDRESAVILFPLFVDGKAIIQPLYNGIVMPTALSHGFTVSCMVGSRRAECDEARLEACMEFKWPTCVLIRLGPKSA